MSNVSDSFKEKIKDNIRKLKGFVEVKYNTDENLKKSVEIDFTEEDRKNFIGNLKNLKDDIRYSTRYGILDDNFILDGSVSLISKKYDNPNLGIISESYYDYDNEKFISPNSLDNITNISLLLSFEKEVIVPNLTIYFLFGKPQNMNVIFYDNSNKVTDILKLNNKNIEEYFINYEFHYNKSINCKKIVLVILDWFGESSHVSISEIDFGLSRLYQDEELIDFNYDEEIDLLNIETPINECSFNIIGAEKFDIANPNNITKYLNNSVIIKPSLGLNNGFKEEYINLGTYYYCSHTTDIENNKVNIIGRVSLEKFIQNEDYKIINETYPIISEGVVFPSYVDFLESLKRAYPNYKIIYNVDSSKNNRVIMADAYLKNTSFVDYLKLYSLIYDTIFTSNRSDEIVFEMITNNVSNYLTLNDMKTRPQIEQLDKFNKISFFSDGGYFTGYDFASDLETYISVKNIDVPNGESYLLIHHDPYSSNYNRSDYTGPINLSQLEGITVIPTYLGTYISSFYIKKDIDSTVSFELQGNKILKLKNDNCLLYEYQDREDLEKIKEMKITIPFDLIGVSENEEFYIGTSKIEEISKEILSKSYKYKIKIDYFGDPTIRPNTIINVETGYEKKDILVTHVTGTYDGGFSGTIEGVFN